MPKPLTRDNPLFFSQGDDTDNLSIDDLMETADTLLEPENLSVEDLLETPTAMDVGGNANNDTTLPAVPPTRNDDLPPPAATAAGAGLPPSKNRKARIKYKDQGVRSNKLLFLTPVALDKFGDSIPDDFMMEGRIDAIPWKGKGKAQTDYIISWYVDAADSPVKLEPQDLTTVISKGNVKLLNQLKLDRDAYDVLHPAKKSAPKIKKPKAKKDKPIKPSRPPHVPQDREVVRIGLTSLRMDASLSSPVRPVHPQVQLPPPTDHPTGEDGESVSDEGSQCPRADPDEDLPDDSYDPEYMENDGDYAGIMRDIQFDYQELRHLLVPPEDMYDGDGPCLKPRVAAKFRTVFECALVCGGMSYSFWKRLTCNSNQYGRIHQVNGKFGGYQWANITVEEMIRFHGILLKMSIDNRSLGGYESYFTEIHQVNAGRDYFIPLEGFPAWANKVMTLSRFKQIRAAFHPEVGMSDIGDKCHQLRFAIDKMNLAARRTFLPGPDLSFDEGGVASRSRKNPVRQYNKDKPNKFRVDFFVLSNNNPEKYFIMHLDVYQGKNAANIGIPEQLHNMPTTQKAVVNSILSSKLDMDPNGKRRLFMDNRYSSAALFILLREQCKILCSGTTRKNRIG